MYLKSALLESIPGISHGFGTFEEPIPRLLADTWNSKHPLWKQVHGTSIARVETHSQACGEVDALYTQAISVPVGVVTADCVPILMAHRTGRVVAAIHAGWRGTRARILRVLWEELIRQGEHPNEWLAAIGPAIGPCCYEVSEELCLDFSKEFAVMGPGVAVPRPRILDLPTINANELKDIGLERVDHVQACTRCSEYPRFHSFRREGGGTRQYSLIMKGASYAE